MSRYDKKKTVLILYAPIGSGHASAADAIKEQFLKYKNVDLIMGDIFTFASPFFCKNLLKSYLRLLHYMPKGYDFLYKWGEKGNSLFLRSIVNKIFFSGMKNFLFKYTPDVVITTHVTPAGIIAEYKKRSGKEIPLVGVVTDYAMHRWWIYDEIDCYIVPDLKIFDEYNVELKDDQKVYDFGIPVHESFCIEKRGKDDIRKALGISTDAFVCLLTGGGEGILPMQEIASAWQEYAAENENVLIIAVCGRNQKLAADLNKTGFNWLRTVEYTYAISDYMKASDVMVSKAGGVSATEAMVVNIPLIIFEPLPGQEYVNTRNLVDRSLAINANDVSEVCRMVLAASKNECIKTEEVKDAQRCLAKKTAAFDIMEKTCEYINL